MAVTIINVSGEDLNVDWKTDSREHTYKLKLGPETLATFRHTRMDGMATLLLRAASAIESVEKAKAQRKNPPCSRCGGSAVVLSSLTGEPIDCPNCNGTGYEVPTK